MYSLENFFTNTAHKKSIFTQAEISLVEKKIYTKTVKGKETPYIKCAIRGKEIKLTPEEVVRQLFIYRLINSYGYSTAQIKLEHAVHFGREVKKADIVIFEEDNPTVEYIIVETKKPKLSDGKEQLRSYCNATGARIGVWTNGEKISFYQRKVPNYFEDIPGIPRRGQKLKDILREHWKISDLTAKDKLTTERKTLSNLIEEMEDEVLANAGVDVFEEVFKLIYTKLFDEMLSEKNPTRDLEFRNYGDTDAGLKETIQNLFDRAKKKWHGIFHDDDKIKLTPSHLAICISSLQNVRLFKSNLDVIDDAFEYLMSKSQKGEKGQFFTPRYVIDMCIKMLNPKKSETMIDTAAGSCGFPVHTIFYLFPNKNSYDFEEYVSEKVFAIDFDEKAVRVARTLNLIAGDGKTNVLHLNALDYGRWGEAIDEDWRAIYGAGWSKFIKLRAVKDFDQYFNFDIVMANPPFAGDIKETRIITRYELGKKAKGSYQSKVGRDILFIERNLQFLKPGGRMAIILPQGRFNNSSDKYIRDFIAEQCRILAVVGLHGNVFKPHTGTKTSVLFVQKWDDKLCPRKDDYPIFFATMQKPSKDNSGDKIYLLKPDEPYKIFLNDSNGHAVVDHDLFNHEGLTQDGIAEAFIQFAKKESLSFFDSSSFDQQKYSQLLEELECTEILLSEVLAKNRMDSHFYEKKYLSLIQQVKMHKTIYLKSVVAKKIATGHTPSMKVREYYGGEIRFVKTDNLREFYIKMNFKDYLTELGDDLLQNTKLKVGDIVVTIIGADKSVIARSALVFEEHLPANINQNIALIRVKQSTVSPEFLAVYLNTKFGKNFLYYYSRQTEQFNLNCEEVGLVEVPVLNKSFQEKISELVQSAHEKLKQSQDAYHAAEKILSAELGLDNFKPSTENVAVKSFSASFGRTGRLDAEFYQPKYDDIERKLIELSKGRKIIDSFTLVKDICSREEKFYNYVEIGDVNVGTGEAVANKIATEDLPENAKIMTQEGDVIVSKVRPNRGAVSLLRENKLLVSGAFSVLRMNEKFLPEVLQVLLRLPIYRELMLKFNVGTSYPVIKDLDVINLPLPIISEDVQEKISAQVEESFRLRDESKRLLELAKRAVEIAIEEGEDAALKILEGENL